MNYLREKDIEQQLIKQVQHRGGICPKFISPGMDGMPDRIVLFPRGQIGFVEVKAPDKKPRKLQLYRHEQLRLLGFKVYVLDYPEQILGILDDIEGGDAC